MSDNLLQRTFDFLPANVKALLPKAWLPGEPGVTTESGARTTPENALKYLYRQMWVDPELRQAILDIREMDKADGRVKRIHARIARDIVKGGLQLIQGTEDKALADECMDFCRRLQLDRVEKLRSDARGLVMEGNLPLQVVLDEQYRVVAAVRMPSETILPNVDESGRFKDVTKAYSQIDILTGAERAVFPLWQLQLARLEPDNFDDLGALGRPFLDANRAIWRKLRMTDEDLVIRRRTRAPLRMSHVLEGASEPDLETYRAKVEKDRSLITTDYYANKKGGVSAVQGDANLDQMADVIYLLDSFFSGTPMPKGLMGFSDKLQRDILEDLKRDYYEEVDGLQDTLSFAYTALFKFHLLLKGINPDASYWCIEFAERRTETPNQTADLGLKMQALGYPQGMIWERMGDNAAYVRARKEWEQKNVDPYPQPDNIAPQGGARVKITPGNRPKGESATSITNN